MSVFRTSNNSTGTSTTSERIPPTQDRNISGARDAYPINRPAEETFPDGPTERLDPDAKSRRKRGAGVFFPVLLALLALVLAAAAALLAYRAMDVARSAARHAPGPARSTGSDGTGYSVAYAMEPLRVQVGCSAVLFLDLDEPRANADEHVSDLRYDSSCGKQAPRLSLGPGAAGGAQIAGADTDAAGCDRAIRTSPLGPGASVPVRTGVVLCVLTDATPAEMVLVQVTDVDASGIAGMRATSWKVTG